MGEAGTTPQAGSRIGALVVRIERLAVALMMFSVILVVLYGVVVRYLPLPSSQMAWTDELSRLIFVWLVFISAYLCLKEDGHFRMDFAYNRFPARFRGIVDLVMYVMILGLLVLLLQGTVSSMITLFPNKFSGFWDLPVPVFYAALLVSFLLMAVHVMRIIIGRLRRSP